MLHYEAVDSPALGLLKKLIAIPLFRKLRLVGGTALALQTGHRKSVDLGLFGDISLEELELTKTLAPLGTITWLNKSANIKSLLIDGIKTDFVNYTYPWLTGMIIQDELRLADKKDIAAMKLAAITGRGAKKDFIDLYQLLQTFSLGEMMDLFAEKYADGSAFLVLKSLTYFDDAEKDEMPVMLMPVEWDTVKKTITEKHRQYLATI